MVADEMRRAKEKNYDKWMDLAQSIYDIIDYSLICRDDLTIIFVAHTQTDHDENGYMFTHIKTSGRKLDKICLESKFPVVLLAKCVDGNYLSKQEQTSVQQRLQWGLLRQTRLTMTLFKLLLHYLIFK